MHIRMKRIQIMLVIAIGMAMTSCSNYKYVGTFELYFWDCDGENIGETVTRLDDKGQPYNNPKLKDPGGLGKKEYINIFTGKPYPIDCIYLAPDEWKDGVQMVYLIRDGDTRWIDTVRVEYETRRWNIAKAYCDKDDESGHKSVYHNGMRVNGFVGINNHIVMCHEKGRRRVR